MKRILMAMAMSMMASGAYAAEFSDLAVKASDIKVSATGKSNPNLSTPKPVAVERKGVDGAKITIIKSGSATEFCPQENPRCLWDFHAKSSARRNAIDAARFNAENACSAAGGLIVSENERSSDCTSVSGWLDSYVCTASYQVSCDLSKSNTGNIPQDLLNACVKRINGIAETSLFVSPYSGNIFQHSLPPPTQARAVCTNAIPRGYVESLGYCLQESFKHDPMSSTTYALKYCDLAGRKGFIEPYVAAFSVYRGYNFEYIYQQLAGSN